MYASNSLQKAITVKQLILRCAQERVRATNDQGTELCIIQPATL